MKHVIMAAIVLISNPLFAQSIPALSKENKLMIQQAVNSVLSDPTLNSPRPSWANHDSLNNRMLDLIMNGYESILLKARNTKGFSAIMLMKNSRYFDLNQTDSIKKALHSLRRSFGERKYFYPDRISIDTLLGDVSRVEVWETKFVNSMKTEFTILFINHQLTNILIREIEEKQLQ